jgi:hypothetical protein
MAKAAVNSQPRSSKATKAKVIPLQPKAVKKVKSVKLAKTIAKDTAPFVAPDWKPPKWEHEVWTINEYLENIIFTKSIKIDPITNRPATVEIDSEKNRGIIECILNGIGLTSFTIRNITNAPEMRALYPKMKFVIHEGGHRSRAIKGFFNDEFSVSVPGLSGEYLFSELPERFQKAFLNFKLVINIVTCTAEQAQEIFDCHNRVTAVKGYSVIMANEQSKVCAYVRQVTKTWPEYGNTCHPVFSMSSNKPVCFNSKVSNKGNLWDTFVFVSIHKVTGGGNVVAGEEESKAYVKANVDVPENVKREVKKFWDTFYGVYDVAQNKITNAYFGCFQALYFHLYKAKKRSLNIYDVRSFAQAFNKAFHEIMKTQKDTKIDFGGELLYLGKFISDASIAFTKPNEQTVVALEFIKRMEKNKYVF